MFIPWWAIIIIVLVIIIIMKIFGHSIDNLSNRVDDLEEKNEEKDSPPRPFEDSDY
jgi:uncharacterized membrane protein YvbJ